MNTQISNLQPKSRLLVSTAISLLLHGLLLLALHVVFITHKKPDPARNSTVLHVKLAARPAPAIQKSHDEKLITIKSTAPLKVSDSPIDKPKEPETQKNLSSSTNPKEEKITGIAFPGAFPSPFQNFQTRGEDFFMQHNAEMTAQQLHQQMVMQNVDQQHRQQEAAQKLKQLEAMLHQLAASHPEQTGRCFIENRPVHTQITLRCDNPELLAVVKPLERLIFDYLKTTQEFSMKITGFTFTGQANRLIILN